MAHNSRRKEIVFYGKNQKEKEMDRKANGIFRGFKTGKNKAQRLYTEISIRGNRNTTSAPFRV